MPRQFTRLATTSCAVLVAAATVLAGCGSSSQSGSATKPTVTTKADSKLAAMVPQEIKADKKIRVGTDASYAPNEFMDADGKTVIGMDVELYDAIAAKLGLRVDWVPSEFGNILPAVQSGKYEAGVSSFTINPERTKQVLMISYFNSPIQWVTEKGNPKKVSIDSACGLQVGVQKDTVEVPDLEARSKKCVAAGKPKIGVQALPGQDTVTSNVVTGKYDAMTADLPIAVYAVRQSQGKLALLGEPYGQAPYGFIVGKDQKKFADAIAAATKAIIDDGTYAKILKKWGNEKGAITADRVKVESASS
ncbi:polar amino acid transport system substrate-binding protein [Actinopolymorpha cephalotaxi]|uniref:Polar amino acid transport system substrate-binding protein n=1 Tax=Actinopolymorpha cephalotaxi TaxID=504797 RepID=A0A1I2Z5F1_9ACTN|nr:ABC transporter substrate-binding protein [Actinopolymorpha cephalotaxi]NYH81874.1 polar amino acid transport system substrate-binding protein [Actinopolymorpha cephalotaxi]SFH33073.1 polar amino acid transport system substrate-binding protein [Actinopolymorpha cephalotaxi]